MTVKPALFLREPEFVVRCGNNWLSLQFNDGASENIRLRGPAKLRRLQQQICEAVRRSRHEEEVIVRSSDFMLRWHHGEFRLDLADGSCRISELTLLGLRAWLGYLEGDSFSSEDNLEDLLITPNNSRLVVSSRLWRDRAELDRNEAGRLAAELLAMACDEKRERAKQTFGAFPNHLTTSMDLYGDCQLKTHSGDTILALTRSSQVRLALALHTELTRETA